MKSNKKISRLQLHLKEMDLETRILFMALIAGGVISLLSVAINIILQMSLIVILTPLIMAFIYAGLIYSVFHNPNNHYAGYIAIVVSTLTIFPSLWLNSGGLTGSTPYYYLFMVFLTTVVLRKFKFRVILFLQFIIASALILIEIIKPNTISPYLSFQAHFMDIFFAFAIITVFISIMTIYIMDNYHRSIEALKNTKQDLEKANKNLEWIATTDELTRLYNRRFAMNKLSEIIAEVSLNKVKSFGVLMLDIDHFKLINDNFGHLAGDDVLKRFGQVLIDHCGDSHLPTRIGGEEFLIITYVHQFESFQKIAESIKKAIDLTDWSDIHPDLKVTISIGAYYINHETPLEDKGLEQVLNHVDHSLYAAKNNGRNQIHYFNL